MTKVVPTTDKACRATGQAAQTAYDEASYAESRDRQLLIIQ